MLDFKVKINEGWIKVNKKDRECMYKDCSEKSIKSHVLQKNGIIRQIAEQNHLIQLMPKSAFNMEEEGLGEIKKVGVNNVYTFKGFCNKHDTEVFWPIEDKKNINLFDSYQQALFSYRGLCQEIRKKEIAEELMQMLIEEFPPEMKNMVNSTLDGFQDGQRNLLFFKEQFEEAFESEDLENFYFETIKIPKIDLCISAPLNIGGVSNPENLEYEEWRASRQIPFATSFLNIFPFKSDSYVIAGFHKEYPCDWTKKKISKFRNSKSKVIKKELSDIVVLRLEFWAMSPKLFRKIPDTTLKKYKSTFKQNVFDYSEELKTKINLFKDV